MNHDKIILVEDDEIISESEQISESLNNFFADAIINLNIPQYEDLTSNTSGIDDPVLRAIEKYKNHSSIKLHKTQISPLRLLRITLTYLYQFYLQNSMNH